MTVSLRCETEKETMLKSVSPMNIHTKGSIPSPCQLQNQVNTNNKIILLLLLRLASPKHPIEMFPLIPVSFCHPSSGILTTFGHDQNPPVTKDPEDYS